MKLVYYKDPRGNFGDDLNPSFFSTICPGYNQLPVDKLYGIGTLLNQSLGTIANSIIFGSGYGQGDPPQIDHATTTVLGVRGPITASALGVTDPELIIGDPALHLPHLPEFNTGRSLAPGAIVVALHHRTAEPLDFASLSDDKLFFLDPGVHSVNDYIATIRDAKAVLAEAMHGAIVAAGYGVPFCQVKILGKFDEQKWRDFNSSINATDDYTRASLTPPRIARSRTLALALARRRYLPRRTFYRHQRVDGRDSQRLIQEARRIAAECRYFRTDNAQLNTLASRCKVAIDKLNELAEGRTAGTVG